MKHEKLQGVCNGLHLWNLNKDGQQVDLVYKDSASFSKKELVETLKKTAQTKAILIVDREKQKEIAEELEDLEIDLEKIPGCTSLKGHKIVAKKLDRWSSTADLWMVKWLSPADTWKTSK